MELINKRFPEASTMKDRVGQQYRTLLLGLPPTQKLEKMISCLFYISNCYVRTYPHPLFVRPVACCVELSKVVLVEARLMLVEFILGRRGLS